MSGQLEHMVWQLFHFGSFQMPYFQVSLLLKVCPETWKSHLFSPFLVRIFLGKCEERENRDLFLFPIIFIIWPNQKVRESPLYVLHHFPLVSVRVCSVPWRTQPRRPGSDEPGGKHPFIHCPLWFMPLKNMVLVSGLLWTRSSTRSCILCPKLPLTLPSVSWWWKDVPSPQMEPYVYLSRSCFLLLKHV